MYLCGVAEGGEARRAKVGATKGGAAGAASWDSGSEHAQQLRAGRVEAEGETVKRAGCGWVRVGERVQKQKSDGVCNAVSRDV